MLSPDSRDRLFLLIVGLFVLLAPVLIIVLTLGALVLFADLALGRITPVELLELYILDLVLFVVLAYGVYRLTLWMVEHRVPAYLDAIEVHEAERTPDDESESTEDR
jgi:hypothetical protein